MRSGDGLEVLCQYGVKKQFSVEGVQRGKETKVGETGKPVKHVLLRWPNPNESCRVRHVMVTPYYRYGLASYRL